MKENSNYDEFFTLRKNKLEDKVIFLFNDLKDQLYFDRVKDEYYFKFDTPLSLYDFLKRIVGECDTELDPLKNRIPNIYEKKIKKILVFYKPDKEKSYIFFKDKDDFRDLLMGILEEDSSYKSELISYKS